MNFDIYRKRIFIGGWCGCNGHYMGVAEDIMMQKRTGILRLKRRRK